MQNIINYELLPEKGHTQNVFQFKNMISPFADEAIITKLNSNGKKVIDSNYGLVYDECFLEAKACVYGKTNKIPEYSGDRWANYGFLRIPFRKIPRVKLNSRKELDELLSSIENRDPNLILQYRGQNSEYCINRTVEEKLSLFGDGNVVEPSLVPSAVRRNILMEDIMPLWNNILHKYLDYLILKSPSEVKSIYLKSITNLKTNIQFSVFSLALAQHYGFPSVGLDTTSDIETALFFATHKFENENGKYFYRYNLPELKKPPVIYVMAPAERLQLDYKEFKPDYSEFLRPDKQAARFLHTGWGLNKNRCARQIWLAIYLDTMGDFGKMNTVEDLFPKEDEFANFIKPIIEKINNENLSPYFENFYMFE